MKKYVELVLNKSYDEMNDEETKFCIKEETKILLPQIEALREQGKDDVYISYWLKDLYDNYEIYDDVPIADTANISDEDYAKALSGEYDAKVGKENPFKVVRTIK